jgi:thiamine-phosphate pyrophosphorylase
VYFGRHAIIGFHTHTLEQAIEAINLPINYLAIGPFSLRKTKENPEKIVGLEGVKKVREAIGNLPLVAIGGINSGKVFDRRFEAGRIS